MKRCSNPGCDSTFLYSDSKTACPFCHRPLVYMEAAAAGPMIPFDISPAENTEEAPEFLVRRGRRIQCTGRITEIDHQELFYSSFHKLINALIYGEPIQFAHQTLEYTIRVEPITQSFATETTDFCLFGNYLGRLQIGDEIRIQARRHNRRRIVQSIENLTTGSRVSPGAQIRASVIRIMLLLTVLLIAALFLGIVHFFTSGAAFRLLWSVIDAVMPCLILLIGIVIIIRSAFPHGRSKKGS